MPFVFQNEGSALEASIQTIERSWAQTDIGQLQTAITAATSTFKAVGSDVIDLRSEAHVVTEAARGRSQQLQVLGANQWEIFLSNYYIVYAFCELVQRLPCEYDLMA